MTSEEEKKREEFSTELLQWQSDRLGVPSDFVTRLADEDDWTFVIKLHALLEAGLNHAIIVNLNKPQLTDMIVRLDTSDRDQGKMAFVKALDLLTKEERRFVHMFSTLRNSLVHNVKNVDFSFSKWVSEMQPAARKNFRDTVAEAIADTVTHEGKSISKLEYCLVRPRIAIWVNSIAVMAHVLYCDRKAETVRLTEEIGALHVRLAQAQAATPPESSPTES